ncbi:ABC transporter permease [Mycoplasmopsis primatum]|uniref:ABC transporter permease n=1 Tax=Mycoplasmopsis primatum TaxID=55604 RepID=UPI000496C380|nr:ABC transporter permease [Mycoplasmopsis primatum]
MNANEFNTKYKLDADALKKLVISNRPKVTNSVAGKPKILIIEVIKRFFTNPIVVISTGIFLAIILTAIIVTINPVYKPGTDITRSVEKLNYWNGGLSDIDNLPPMFSPYVQTNKANVINDINLFTDPKYPFSKYLKEYLDFEKISSERVSIDFYKYYYARQLNFALNKAYNEGYLITDNMVSYLKTQVDQFTLKTYFGTTHINRDIWGTVWAGTLESIRIAMFVATVEVIIGVSVGAYLGFHAGKWIDTVLMRFIDIFQAPPSIIWLLMFVSLSKNPGEWVLIAGLLFTGWTWPIYSTRLFIITVKDEEYILASKSVGASTNRQIFFHALPAILGKIAMNFVRRIPAIILSIASLSFLGFYNAPESYNLGKFLYDNIANQAKNPWIMIIPATILLLICLSLQFIAIGLHDALDPKVIKIKR